jgi:single-strand DNA-binding protein
LALFRDPELKQALSLINIASFCWRHHGTGKDKQGNYINNAIDVEIWGKSAEVVVDRCKKGDCIIVSGNVKRQEWADKTTGDKRTKHVLSVQRFEFLPRTTPTEEPAF